MVRSKIAAATLLARAAHNIRGLTSAALLARERDTLTTPNFVVDIHI